MRTSTTALLALGVVFLFARLASTISTPQLCYSDIDKLAPDYIVPCWTSNKTPHYSCCKAGNKCLKHNACYDGETGVTYQYGCTDPMFKDEHCPQKCNLDRDISSWVGLVYCDGANGMPDKTWVCHHPDNCKNCSNDTAWDPQIERFPATECEDLQHDGQYVAFNEIGTLSDIVSLPAATDLPRYFSENLDRWQSVTTTEGLTKALPTTGSVTTAKGPSILPSTLQGSYFSATSTSTASGSASPTPSSSDPGPIDNKTGLWVGLSCGLVLVLLLVGFGVYYFCLRSSRRISFTSKKRKKPDSPEEARPSHPVTNGTVEDGPAGPSHAPGLPANDIGPTDWPHSQISGMDGSLASGFEQIQTQPPDAWPLALQALWRSGQYGPRVSGGDQYPMAELHDNHPRSPHDYASNSTASFDPRTWRDPGPAHNEY